jgi:hypothetical protein
MSAMTAVRERPILFSANMVRAILAGRKSQTRRVILPQPVGAPGKNFCHEPSDPFLSDDGVWRFMCGEVSYDHNDVRCPFGQPGDRLWVRETFGLGQSIHHSRGGTIYRADVGEPGILHGHQMDAYGREFKGERRWRPSIHMPRWASRITLEIRDVRVERVQEIAEADAIAEGLKPLAGHRTTVQDRDGSPLGAHENADYPARERFHDFWDSLNAKRGYGWDSNPWVWVVDFSRVETA